MYKLAKAFSYVFHPVIFFWLMPFMVVYRQTQSIQYSLKWQLFSSLFIVITLIFLFLGKRLGKFSDYDISKREERPKFYSFIFLLAMCYLGTSLFFRGLLFPLSIVTVGIVFGILVFDAVNYYVKASVHLAIATMFVTTIGILYGLHAAFSLIWILPLLMWSRVYLKRHTVIELLTGSILGLLLTLLTFYLDIHLK
jgi:hypothetical protein